MIEPLTPADVDLRGLPWMRLDTSRLLDSDLFALSTGDEFKAAVALWCKSWTQQPAASLPDDDRILAHLSGAGARWKKIKAMALRGWLLCSDGRLYHPVVAEQALEAWAERLEYRASIDASNARKQKERAERAAIFEQLKAAGHEPAWNTPTSKLRELSRHLSQESSAEPATPVAVTVTAKTGQGRDGNKDQEQDQERSLRSPRAPAEPPPAATDEAHRLPDGTDPAAWDAWAGHWQAQRKWSIPRRLLALGHLRQIASDGGDTTAVLRWALSRGLADLADCWRRMQADAADSRRPKPGESLADASWRASTERSGKATNVADLLPKKPLAALGGPSR